MNLKTLLTMLCLMAGWTTGVCAQETLTARLADVKSRLKVVLQGARSSPEAATARQAVEAARAAYDAAERSTPGVQDLEARIAEAREELRQLCSQRNALLRANSAELEAKRAALGEAESAYAWAMRGGAEGESLLRQRNAIIREMSPEQLAELRAVLEGVGGQ